MPDTQRRRRRFFLGFKSWRRNSAQPSYAPSVASADNIHTEHLGTSSVGSSHSRLDVATPSISSVDRPASNNVPEQDHSPPPLARPQHTSPSDSHFNPLSRLSRVSNGLASPILTAFPAPPSYAPIPPPMPNPQSFPPQPPNPQPFQPQPLRELPNTGKLKSSLIIGIDFGTTRSGVAFAYISPDGQVREDLISEWPGSGTSSKAKVSVKQICHMSFYSGYHLVYALAVHC